MSLAIRKSRKHDSIFDVVVIGGGPAGMMAAGTAAKMGAKVLLVEKNKILGKKLLITGGGRCNVLNAELDTRTLLSFFTDSSKFLYSTFSQFGVQETLDFFHKAGMPTVEEDLKRVFPKTQKAESVHNVMTQYLIKNNVEIKLDSEITSIDINKNKIKKIILKNGTSIVAKNYILATGGLSRPDTGSTGDGFNWLKLSGHSIKEGDTALVPISIKEKWIRRLSGISLTNISISLYQDQTLVQKKIGKVLLTHFGLSGPSILNMSKNIGEILPYKNVSIGIDLFPKLDKSDLDKIFIELFMRESRKKIKNVLSEILEQRLAEALCDKVNINLDTFCHSITKEERLRLVTIAKDIRLSVTGLLGTDKAVITSGGISLAEIDTKSMRSKIISNLYVTGDLLDIERPSGGYSLQLCWTTGYVAGKHSAL